MGVAPAILSRQAIQPMIANKLMAAVFGVLTVGMTNSVGVAADALKRDVEAGARVRVHKPDDSNVLWSADPKHGWVQTKEKHEPRDHNKTQDNAKQKKQKNQAAKH